MRQYDRKLVESNQSIAAADPGFPIGGGGAEPLRGGHQPLTWALRQKCMQKQKNWILLGRGRRRRPPRSANE